MNATIRQFWVDVGGTFTDCIGRDHAGQIVQHKTLSSGVVKGVAADFDGQRLIDPRRINDPDGVWSGYTIRLANRRGRVADFANGVLQLSSLDGATEFASPPAPLSYELYSHEPAPLIAIRYVLGCGLNDPLPPLDIRLGTTRGTNALVTRSGARTALVTTMGFRDILRIGYQVRPDLFALDIRRPDELYAFVVEVAERMDPRGRVLQACQPAAIEAQLKDLRDRGIDSLAIVLLHACANPKHELVLGEIAAQVGFSNISLSHEVASLRKLVPRGDTTVMDAYLNPVLRSYIGDIQATLHPDSRLQLMTSSGGLTSAEQFRGRDSILSGPAGGVVGVARVAQRAGFSSAIGFDMGGTSTDVSRWAGEFELEYETEKAGVRVASPMMAIETVAAGGGSLCRFDGVKLTVGPESAGADPGPACYGKGGPLAVSDLNFYLGKLLPTAFPFALDRMAVDRLLTDQCRTIAATTGQSFSPVELALGYQRIANTNMAEAIRCISVDRGIDPRGDTLVAFGGAAGQHACAVADELGIREILLHPSAGVLSALGIGLAEITEHREVGVYRPLESRQARELERTFAELEHLAAAGTGSAEHEVETSRYLDLRFIGLDEPIHVRQPDHGDYQQAYEQEFQQRCGYLPDDRTIEVVTARVTAVSKEVDRIAPSRVVQSKSTPRAADFVPVYFDKAATRTGVFHRNELVAGELLVGPAIVTESIATLVVDPGWQAEVMSGGELLLCRSAEHHRQAVDDSTNADPVRLEVFNKRFAAIATQMGTTLRKNSRSVNVKERLDFSCAIFTAAGDLVVNAPHVPVHLGAMGATVRDVVEHMQLNPGDVIITNDPYRGGSHLPDVTVITPVHDAQGQLMFLTASRAHHAEIGGISPGSMPAFSKNLSEEGVLIRARKVIEAGVSRVDDLKALLASGAYPSRDPDTNVADVIAQIAANRLGATNLLKFVQDFSWPVVASYMQFIQDAAEQKTRQALAKLPQGTSTFVDYLDDGSPICVQLTIEKDSAILDFTGTGEVLAGNLNANRAIVSAAILYCLRLLIDEDIPLNAGVLHPIQIVLPVCLLNPAADEDPRRCPAVAGGNVETSQRVVDVILGAFGIAAASQGTMNNFLFGDQSSGYYETICGGAGATRTAPGADAVHTHMTNTRLTDPEVLENRFPVRLRRFEIRQNSGGLGQYPGGNGAIRELEFLAPLQVSLLTQRRAAYLPYGMHGGAAGRAGINTLIQRNGTSQDLGGTASFRVSAGDVIRIETPGGGGWGSARTE